MLKNVMENWRVRIRSEDAQFEVASAFIILPVGAEYDVVVEIESYNAGVFKDLKTPSKMFLTISRDYIEANRGRMSGALDEITIDIAVAYNNDKIHRIEK